MQCKFFSFVFFFLSFVFSFPSYTTESKVVFITGTSRGIGLAMAEQLVAAGYSVYGGSRSGTHDSSALFNPMHRGHFYPIFIDVTQQASVEAAVHQIIEKEGRIDILINNAGYLLFGTVEHCTIEEAKKQFDTNFFGTLSVIQTVLPYMRQQQKGHIINISSRSGFRPLPSLSLYAATKFALEAVSETMAISLKPWNIKVSIVEPGPVQTDLDNQAVIGSRLNQQFDPYYEQFKKAGFLLENGISKAQDPKEIALLVQEIIESKRPLFRYQTTDLVHKQAASRFVDPTGQIGIEEILSTGY